MEVTKYAPGTPSHIDIGSPDPRQTAAFYGELFGWEIRDLGPDAGGYMMAFLRDKAVAGIGPAQNPGPPYWATYVTVDDVDKTTEVVKSAGGTVIVEPMDVMEAGRMAVYIAPDGAVVSAWQPGASIGAELVNEPGTLVWNELLTTEVEAVKAFYAEVFGWTAKTHEDSAMPYTEFEVDGRSIAGAMALTPEMGEMPPNWGIYFAVDDVDAIVERATAKGATLVAGPMDIEPGRFATLIDPLGAAFSVMKVNNPGS